MDVRMPMAPLVILVLCPSSPDGEGKTFAFG